MVKIICGLGNPGRGYEHTRHNLGFDIVDLLAEKLEIRLRRRASRFDYAVTRTKSGSVYLVKPSISVNRSGPAVGEALRRFEADPTELFVINDDFHLSLGTLRIRKSGTSGGHNGLESIIDELGRRDFPRMRVGIGPLPSWAVADGGKIPDFVLSRFEPAEEETVEQVKSLAVEALEVSLNDGLELAISRYNRSSPTPGT